MNKLVVFAACLMFGLTFGCGDDASGGGGDGEGAHDAMSTSTASSTGATTSTGNQATLQAPVLDEVEPMHGALHTFWTNTTPDCDMVEGERKIGAGTFEVIFSVPGTVDNEMDDAATDPMSVYTYRLRCMKGSEYSPYSNEVSASPMAG